MRISDWSSDVCSSDLKRRLKAICWSGDRDWSRKTRRPLAWKASRTRAKSASSTGRDRSRPTTSAPSTGESGVTVKDMSKSPIMSGPLYGRAGETEQHRSVFAENSAADGRARRPFRELVEERTEEHTSELQSLMRNY